MRRKTKQFSKAFFKALAQNTLDYSVIIQFKELSLDQITDQKLRKLTLNHKQFVCKDGEGIEMKVKFTVFSTKRWAHRNS